LYSITSSARASSVGGTSRPSMRAVWWLMTSSNFDDCTTGRSAGLAPFRTRPKAEAKGRAMVAAAWLNRGTHGSPHYQRVFLHGCIAIEATCCRIAGSRRVLARMRVSDVCNGGTRRLTFLQNNDDTDCDTIRGTRGTKEDWHEQA